jgi:ATP-dependent Clp protease ATP-binding subunit ClpC
MYERFTNQAHKVMQLATEEAKRLNHEYLCPEHLLLGLVKEDSGTSQVLRKLDVDPRKIRLEVENLIEGRPHVVTMGKLPLTFRARKVIEYAKDESEKLKHNFVGAAHILLGLLRQNESVAAQVLMNLGLRLESLRTELENVFGRPTDRGDEPPLSSPTKQTSEQPVNEAAVLSKVCPKCSRSPVTQVIWLWERVSSMNLEDVQAGRAILAASFDKRGPSWVCLRCSPKCAEVHLLGLEEHKLAVEKENAVVAADFEKAAKCRDRQIEMRRKTVVLLDELLREK